MTGKKLMRRLSPSARTVPQFRRVQHREWRALLRRRPAGHAGPRPIGGLARNPYRAPFDWNCGRHRSRVYSCDNSEMSCVYSDMDHVMDGPGIFGVDGCVRSRDFDCRVRWGTWYCRSDHVQPVRMEDNLWAAE